MKTAFIVQAGIEGARVVVLALPVSLAAARNQLSDALVRYTGYLGARIVVLNTLGGGIAASFSQGNVGAGVVSGVADVFGTGISIRAIRVSEAACGVRQVLQSALLFDADWHLAHVLVG